jgi:hypothetical protein
MRMPESKWPQISTSFEQEGTGARLMVVFTIYLAHSYTMCNTQMERARANRGRALKCLFVQMNRHNTINRQDICDVHISRKPNHIFIPWCSIKTNYMYTSSAQNIPCTVLAYRGSVTTALNKLFLKVTLHTGTWITQGKQLKKSGFLAAISVGCSAPNQDLEKSVICKWL